jgi:hypothetical protein
MTATAVSTRIAAQDHVIADLDVGHGAADFLHNPGTFVTENHGQRELNRLLLDRNVGVAYASRHDPYSHFVITRWQQVHLAQLEGLSGR